MSSRFPLRLQVGLGAWATLEHLMFLIDAGSAGKILYMCVDLAVQAWPLSTRLLASLGSPGGRRWVAERMSDSALGG